MSSRSIASAMVRCRRWPARPGRRRAASARRSRRPRRPGPRAGTPRPGSGRPPAAPAGSPRSYRAAPSLRRSTRPSAPAPTSSAVATQVRAAPSRTRASSGVRPAESTMTRIGCRLASAPASVAGGQVRVVGEHGADPDHDRVHGGAQLLHVGPRVGRGDPLAGAVERGRPTVHRGRELPDHERARVAGGGPAGRGQPGQVAGVDLGRAQPRARRRPRARAACRPRRRRPGWGRRRRPPPGPPRPGSAPGCTGRSGRCGCRAPW